MAWHYLKLRQLAIRKSSGGDDIIVSPVNPCGTLPETNAVIQNNGLNYDTYLSLGPNQQVRRDALIALPFGTINLYGTIYDEISGNQYIDLYNPLAGHDAAFIRFTKINGYPNIYAYSSVKCYYNGQNTTLFAPTWQAFYNRNDNRLVMPQELNISFMQDDFGLCSYIVARRSVIDVTVGNPATREAYARYSGNVNNLIVQNCLHVLINGNVQPDPPPPSSDPYSGGGYSTGTDTGTGTFDDTSESVPLPTTYALSATAAGIMSQYVLTEANLAAFGSWLWNGGTIVDDLKHFFQSPMEAIFSVGILPFTPSDTTPYNVYVGALAATGVQGGLVGDTVEKISCGSIDFDGYYGGALDYNPYTKIELFLPYCGTLTLNADEVMGHTISVDYYCDTITGDCVAFVSDEERVLHQVRGNCFIQIPLAARDFTALYSSAIAAIGTIAAGLATAASGGLSAPVAVGMGSSMAANAMNAKTHIARAGGVSGMAGFMSIQTPYVIMTIPNQCLPEFQNDFQGYPLFITKRLGDFSGFTKVYEIHLDGLDCTDAEAKEIYELLKGGVIL